jgi:hypothetical protein
MGTLFPEFPDDPEHPDHRPVPCFTHIQAKYALLPITFTVGVSALSLRHDPWTSVAPLDSHGHIPEQDYIQTGLVLGNGVLGSGANSLTWQNTSSDDAAMVAIRARHALNQAQARIITMNAFGIITTRST